MSDISEIMTDKDKIFELEQQLLMANAYIERSREFLLAQFTVAVELTRFDLAGMFKNELEASPKQSLLLHDADVIEKMIIENRVTHNIGLSSLEVCFVKDLKFDAQKLREQANS